MNIQNFEDFPTPLKIVLMTLVCAIFYCLFYVLYISDLNRRLSKQVTQESELKTQYQALSNTINTMQDEVDETPKIQAQLTEWQGKLIKSSQLPDLLNEILKIGTSNQLQFNLFTPGAEIQDGPYLKVPIKTVVAGSYKQITTFVTQVANLSSIVVISDFSISTEESPTNIVIKDNANNEIKIKPLIADLTLEVYYLQEKKT